MIRAHDLDSAVRQKRADSSDGSEFGCQERTDDTCGQGDFDDGVIPMPDDDAADIAFVSEFLHFVGQAAPLYLNLFSVFLS